MAKERKTINVSLQSKKYLEPVNKILNEWEADSLNLSTQICDTLLMMQKLKSSGTFGSVLAVYELIERLIRVYDIQDPAQLEKIFSEVVTINHSKLGKLVTNLNPEQPLPKPKSIKHVEEVTVTSQPEQISSVKAETVIPQPSHIETEISETHNSEDEIPLDFLLNS